MNELIHWIPTKERLPDDETTVMIYSAKHDEPVCSGFYEGNAWFLPDGMPLLAKPTHWADMPAGPDQQTNQTIPIEDNKKDGSEFVMDALLSVKLELLDMAIGSVIRYEEQEKALAYLNSAAVVQRHLYDHDPLPF